MFVFKMFYGAKVFYSELYNYINVDYSGILFYFFMMFNTWCLDSEKSTNDPLCHM